jgi:hypothetical protein
LAENLEAGENGSQSLFSKVILKLEIIMKVGICVFLTAIFLGIAVWTFFNNQTAVKNGDKYKAVEVIEKARGVETNILKKEVVFENISFTYDTDLFSKVRSEIIQAQPLKDATHKPDSVYPQHINFTLASNSKNKSTSEISVYLVEEYKQAHSVEKHYVNIVAQNFKELKRILEKPQRITASSKTELPFIKLVDAGQVFHARTKVVNFQNGKGLLFLTQYTQDAFALINNQQIEYIYQGLSDDRKYFIFMSFPVSTSELPEDYDDKNHGNYVSVDKFSGSFGENQKPYLEYTNRIAVELDKLPAGRFEPDLSKIESLINSLKIK